MVSQLQAEPSLSIQRKVGFEFQVGRLTPRKKHWRDKEPDILNLESDREPCEKGEVIYQEDGFAITADEAKENGQKSADLEIVTVPFEEDRLGLHHLQTTMDRILQKFQEVTERVWDADENRQCLPATTFGGKDGRYLEIKGDCDTRHPGYETRNDPRVRGEYYDRFGAPATYFAKPQFTAGIKLGNLATYLDDLYPYHREPRDHAAVREQGRKDLARSAMSNLTRRADEAIDTLIRVQQDDPPAKTPELKSLLTLVLSYLTKGGIGTPIYPKSAFPVLARTDFAGMFGLLNEAERRYYGCDDGEMWFALVATALGETDDETIKPKEMDVPFFLGKAYKGSREEKDFAELTRISWVRGMATGRDLLTARNAPQRSYGEDFESMGAMGAKVDEVGKVGDNHGFSGPIFEQRSCREVRPAEWKPYAEAVFKYVYSVNHNSGRVYGEQWDPFPAAAQ